MEPQLNSEIRTVLELYGIDHGRVVGEYNLVGHLVAIANQHTRVAREQRIYSYRDHLRFLYRWISRLNGDKPHDQPESEWRTYVAAMVNYPLAPWQTGDWFED